MEKKKFFFIFFSIFTSSNNLREINSHSLSVYNYKFNSIVIVCARLLSITEIPSENENEWVSEREENESEKPLILSLFFFKDNFYVYVLFPPHRPILFIQQHTSRFFLFSL